MRASAIGLILVLAATVIAVLAIGLASWWVFGVALLLLLGSLFGIDPKVRVRALPNRSVAGVVLALLALVALNALLDLLTPTAEEPGIGLSLGGPVVEALAGLLVVAVAATLVVLFWVALWNAIEEPREAWRTRTYIVALVAFVLAPAFVISYEYADPGARLFQGMLYVLVGIVGVAAALPHLSYAVRLAWGMARERPADESGNA